MAHRGRKNADDALITALAGGATIVDAAAKAAISVRTATRRLGDADFRLRIEETRMQLLRDAVGRLSQYAVHAVNELFMLLKKAESETARLGCARAILEYAFKGSELLGLDARVRLLEDAAEQRDKRPAPTPHATTGPRRNGTAPRTSEP